MLLHSLNGIVTCKPIVVVCRSASGDADDDDWEQTADRTPRGPAAPQGSGQASTSGRKNYTLDWMLHQQDQPECQGLPKDFEAADLIAIGWRSDPRMVSVHS